MPFAPLKEREGKGPARKERKSAILGVSPRRQEEKGEDGIVLATGRKEWLEREKETDNHYAITIC